MARKRTFPSPSLSQARPETAHESRRRRRWTRLQSARVKRSARSLQPTRPPSAVRQTPTMLMPIFSTAWTAQ